ncbi:Uncharacterised protein at_DN0403 [Pycnogonum litorale]
MYAKIKNARYGFFFWFFFGFRFQTLFRWRNRRTMQPLKRFENLSRDIVSSTAVGLVLLLQITKSFVIVRKVKFPKDGRKAVLQEYLWVTFWASERVDRIGVPSNELRSSMEIVSNGKC